MYPDHPVYAPDVDVSTSTCNFKNMLHGKHMIIYFCLNMKKVNCEVYSFKVLGTNISQQKHNENNKI